MTIGLVESYLVRETVKDKASTCIGPGTWISCTNEIGVCVYFDR